MSQFPITSPSGLAFLDQLPAVYEDIRETRVQLQTEGLEYDDLKAAITGVLAQFFVGLSTWGLARWEREFGITPDESKPIEQRRSVIRSKIRGIGTVNAALLDSVAESFEYGQVEVTDYMKNMLGGFAAWTRHANATVTDPYFLTLAANALNQYSSIRVKAQPNKKYAMSVLSTWGRLEAWYYDAANTLIRAANPDPFFTRTSGAYKQDGSLVASGAARYEVAGKNLIPPVPERLTNSNASSFEVLGLYSFKFVATSPGQGVYLPVDVKPNSIYVLKIQSFNCRYAIYNGAGTTPIFSYSVFYGITFNSGNNSQIRIYFSSDGLSAGTFTVTNPHMQQLAPGDNLLGTDGNCEDISKWLGNVATLSPDTINKTNGAQGIVVTSSAASGSTIMSLPVTLDPTKYYIVLGDVKVGTAAAAQIALRLFGSAVVQKISSNASDNSKFLTRYTKVQPSDFTGYTSAEIRGIFTTTAIGQTAIFDSFRIHEISATDYAKIDVDPGWTGDALALKFPYTEPSFETMDRAVMIEEGTTNLIPTGSQQGTGPGWSPFNGSTATVTQGQPDPFGGTGATRIVTTGGAEILKYLYSLGSGLAAGAFISGQIWIKNNAAQAVTVFSNQGGKTQTVTQTDGWKLVKFENIIGDGVGVPQIQFRTPTVADNLDVVIYRPMYEYKPYCTSWISVTRVAETLIVPMAGVLDLATDFTIEGRFTASIDSANVLAFTEIIGLSSILTAIYVQSGVIKAVWNNANVATSNISFVSGDKIFFALKKSGTTLTLFLRKNNGSVNSWSVTLTVGAPDFSLLYLGGGGSNSLRFNAMFSDLRISNRARTDAEIAAIGNSSSPLPVDADTTYKHNFDGSLIPEFNPYLTTPVNVNEIEIRATNRQYTGTVTFANPQLEAGHEITTFEQRKPYTVGITFVSQMGVPPNVVDLQNAIRDILPAHLAVDFNFKFFTYAELIASGKTYAQIAGVTYDTLLNEGVV